MLVLTWQDSVELRWRIYSVFENNYDDDDEYEYINNFERGEWVYDKNFSEEEDNKYR